MRCVCSHNYYARNNINVSAYCLKISKEHKIIILGVSDDRELNKMEAGLNIGNVVEFNSTIHRTDSVHESHSQELLLFYNESDRLDSFAGWPVTFLSANMMASAGFYYLKREDIVRCAFCGVEIGSWVDGDDPMRDHERWAPSCRFVRKLPIIPSNLCTETSGYDVCGRITLTPEYGVGDKSLSSEVLGIHEITAPSSFPRFTTLDARLKSYKMWPIALKVTPGALCEAGFFYTGKGDNTICFHCGGGLRNWEDSDEPWVEHARWFSKCTFVLLTKGMSFVEIACGKKSVEEIKDKKSKVELRCETKETFIGENYIVENKDNKMECKICFSDEVEVVFLPCGHLVACVKCALALRKCPLCRRVVNATIRVYLS